MLLYTKSQSHRAVHKKVENLVCLWSTPLPLYVPIYYSGQHETQVLQANCSGVTFMVYPAAVMAQGSSSSYLDS